MTTSNNSTLFSVERFIVGPMAVNCYLVRDKASGDACIIDPGAPSSAISGYVRKNGLDLRFIINTHGHGDHIAANEYFKAPVYIHKLDVDFLTDADKNLSSAYFFNVTSPRASRILEDGDIIKLGAGTEFKVIHTPGHTPGSISLLAGSVLFSGDTLFRGGVGRTDFAYGDQELLFKSITGKLFKLQDDVMVYPGHGEPSSIGNEKRSNPFFV